MAGAACNAAAHGCLAAGGRGLGRGVTLASSALLVGPMEATAGDVVKVPAFRNELPAAVEEDCIELDLSYSSCACSNGDHTHDIHGGGQPGAVHVLCAMCNHQSEQPEHHAQQQSAGETIVSPWM